VQGASEWAVQPRKSKSYQKKPQILHLSRNGSFDTAYRVNFLTALKLCRHDLKSCYECLLIFLANRFNTAYDLLLNTGNWSGGETSSG
jgi:hypothetical protein